ncbi:adenosylcobalamin-dependent ribonucleoside-diphosphate reductase [Candidatus Woesearchaeota archaeon]|nr:adenosylcobalamin-dependent ribonucleoside-diphosphate reductase [Candidatus Woesearchaeota archaeon]
MAIKVSETARKILEQRYLLKNDKRETIETPEQMFRRVAKAIAAIEKTYGKASSVLEKEFYGIMTNMDFLPNSPTLMNSGTAIGQLSACFVLPVEDSIESIFETLKDMAIIHQSGGGVGFNFSKIRPEGDLVVKSKGAASGPVSFLKIYDKAAEIIKQGGRRRGANIGILRVDHPDIEEFVKVKAKEKMENFNLSVGITDKFMKAAEKDEVFELVNPRTGKAVRKVKAKELFGLITENAWQRGDPGLLFLDTINKKNLLNLGEIEASNPCGEVPLYDYESCNLGSINIANMVTKTGKLDLKKLKKTVHLAVNFLDNVIDANQYPLEEIEEMTKANRKIGLGVMGFAEMLIKMRVRYDDKRAVETAERVMKFINEEARRKSMELGRERGSFPNFKKSKLARKYKAMRNATVTTIAPTGTISIIAGTSSSIEPIFAVAFMRRIMGGEQFFELNLLFEKILKERKLYSAELIENIKQGKPADIPEKLRNLFVTALDIPAEQHIKIQAGFQKYTDNAVSKTVNLREEAEKEDVGNVFKLAHKLGCKGVTIYRYGSKEGQVLNICTTC